MEQKEEKQISCPICERSFPQSDIEEHCSRCIFLHCSQDENKRKRSPSPVLASSGAKSKVTINQKSPRDLHNPSKMFESCTNRNKSDNLAPLFTKSNANSSNSSSSSMLGTHCNVDEDKQESNSAKRSEKKPYDLSFKVPLALQVQPKSLDDFFGQHHILGKGTVLRSLLEKGEIPNMILWGPPGCGKTSLSRVVQEICRKNLTKWKFVSQCAASCGIKEVQNVITLARNDLKYGKRTVLFMDEIHRFNKKQQDVFVQSVERGDIILLGATTENPSFAINSAVLSRCKVIVLEKLASADIYNILENATEFFEIDTIDPENPAGSFEDQEAGLAIENTALRWIADISDGDARAALSNLQLVLHYFDKSSNKIITIKDVEDKLKRAHLMYDKAGEEHYNMISAMHKSIRGSDDNAALYWTTRMILSGEDPRYISRRMVRAASEDIGNADPQALPLAIATMQGCQLIGMPEADVLLAQCAIYLARAPKSREADTALARAKDLIKSHKGPQPVVPMHIRNAPTTLMKNLGYGQLQEGEEFAFMPPEYQNVSFFG